MSETILLIEDNENNRYLLTYLLEQRGYCVLQANDGLAGLARASEAAPALILLDIQLPDMNGFEVAAELRRLESLDAVPIVAVTSHAMVGDRERILAAGCDGYIEKPIDTDTFADEIAAHIASGGGGDDGETADR